MDSKGKNQHVWSWARLAIASNGLVYLIATTSIIFPSLVVAKERNQIAKASTELPVVKSAALGTDIDVPWSKPVRIEDSFEGNYLGIFDRHTFRSDFLDTNARVEVISLWSRNSIRFLLAYRDRNCSLGYGLYPYNIGSGCAASKNTLKITNLYIKLGEQVFRLDGNNSTFKVSDELAAALKNSSPNNVNIRLVAESGEALDSEIGKGTVAAWKTIY
ncbi:hypothetical protein ICL16_44190 [Iningainema sp. BLCCT55]|uniref:Uncharacterized protein n=2 Tax=Iningainema TaxID=1932705 RepID=A0A8J6XVW9_9CYAN|nr:hypothetical protein [Iningainema tapete BLCC-T55]